MSASVSSSSVAPLNTATDNNHADIPRSSSSFERVRQAHLSPKTLNPIRQGTVSPRVLEIQQRVRTASEERLLYASSPPNIESIFAGPILPGGPSIAVVDAAQMSTMKLAREDSVSKSHGLSSSNSLNRGTAAPAKIITSLKSPGLQENEQPKVSPYSGATPSRPHNAYGTPVISAVTPPMQQAAFQQLSTNTSRTISSRTSVDDDTMSWAQGDDEQALSTYRNAASTQANGEIALEAPPKIQLSFQLPKLPSFSFENDGSKSPPQQHPSNLGSVVKTPTADNPHPETSRHVQEEHIHEDRTPRAEEPAPLRRSSQHDALDSVRQEDASSASFLLNESASNTPSTAEEREESSDYNFPKTTEIEKPEEGDGAMLSATALGFGGPSDWEHFGDYDGEEIDDEALYAKPKGAELPSTRSPEGTMVMYPDGSTDGGYLVQNRAPLPTIQERASENLEETNVSKAFEMVRAPMSPAEKSKEQEAQTSPAAPEHPIVSTPVTAVDTSATESRSAQQAQQPPNAATASPQSEARVLPPLLSQLRPDSDVLGPHGAHLRAQERKSLASEETSSPKSMLGDSKLPFAQTERTSVLLARSLSKSKRQSLPLEVRTNPTTRGNSDGDIIIQFQDSPKKPSPETQVAPPAVESTKSVETVPVTREEQSNNGLQQPQQTPTLSVPQTPVTAGLPLSPGLSSPSKKPAFMAGTEMANPYVGLEPFFRGSLNRYIKMLHDEKAATTEEDKYAVFLAFITKETHQRRIMYDLDEDASRRTSKRPSFSIPNVAAQKEDSGKALPSLPKKAAGQTVIPRIIPESASEHGSSKSPPPDAARGEVSRSPPPQKVSSPQIGTQLSSATPDKGMKTGPTTKPSVAVPDAIAHLKTNEPKTPASERVSRILPSPSPVPPMPSNLNPQATAQNNVPAPTLSQATTVRPATQRQASAGSQAGDAAPYEGDRAANRQSLYQPYAGLLRKQSTRHASVDSTRTGSEHEQQRRFVEGGSQYQPKEREFTSPNRPAGYRYTVLEPLLVVIPENCVFPEANAGLASLRARMDAIADDYSFIHKTVLAWDTNAKKSREVHERERSQRGVENEARIEELYNAKEIAYSDIQVLENNFKREEAEIKAREDREEVNSFIASVFDTVWTRINLEMDQLNPLYDECVKLVYDASTGRQMFEPSSSVIPIAPAMETLLKIYQKLMQRHQKAFEAVLERDRRLKKTEVSPWHTLGNHQAVNRIEQRFEEAEKKAILEFCKQKDERAGLLMDALDQNTLRGVGSNQDYMENIMQAIRHVQNTVSGTKSPVSTSTETIFLARKIAESVRMSSESIVKTFHVADMLLNAADYEVSVANAKIKGADAASYKKLREAKTMEDNRLDNDLAHRMKLIHSDSEKTHAEVSKLMSALGHSHSPSRAVSQSGTEDERTSSGSISSNTTATTAGNLANLTNGTSSTTALGTIQQAQAVNLNSALANGSVSSIGSASTKTATAVAVPTLLVQKSRSGEVPTTGSFSVLGPSGSSGGGSGNGNGERSTSGSSSKKFDAKGLVKAAKRLSKIR